MHDRRRAYTSAALSRDICPMQDVVPEATSAEGHGSQAEDHDVYQVVNGVKERATLLHSNWRPVTQAFSRGSSMDDDADEHAQPVDQCVPPRIRHAQYSCTIVVSRLCEYNYGCHMGRSS
jgi:hypothetical protein